MKKTALLALCALALPLTVAQAQASDFTTEPTATAYWQIPLGATRAGKAQPSFGLRMDHVTHDNLGASFFNPTQTPVVDFRFNATGMQGMFVRGINMANPGIMKMGMSEGALFLALSAGIVAIALVDMNNSDSPVNNCDAFALNVDICARFAGYGLK